MTNILQFPDLKANERKLSGQASSKLLAMYGVEGRYYERLSELCKKLLKKESKIVQLKSRMK